MSTQIKIVKTGRGDLFGKIIKHYPEWSTLFETFIRDRWLPCTKRSYYRRPYAIKNQRRAIQSLVGGFGCDELVLYGIRELAPAIPWILPRHGGGELWY